MVKHTGLGGSRSDGDRIWPAKSSPAHRGRVLVVEDHEDTRFMLKTFLEMNGFAVSEAKDGESALVMAVNDTPDLILMDLGLPRFDGLAVTRQIRAHERIGHLPIIFLSGWTDPQRLRAAMDAGCNDYLVKPVEPDRIVAIIEHWLTPKARFVAAWYGAPEAISNQ